MSSSNVQEYPVIYIQAATCSGCSVSILNAVSPSIRNVLLDELLPGKHVNLRFHATIMAGSGEIALQVMKETAHHLPNQFILAVEGAIPTGAGGAFGTLGENEGTPVPMTEWMRTLGSRALAVLAVGTCAAFGGIFAAKPNPTGCVSVETFLSEAGIAVPLINLPGCPPHPDWFTGTLASVLLKGLPSPDELDEYHRPKLFYGQLIHENCPRRAYYDEGKFAKKFGDEGCLYELGCKGPITHADCPLRRWNNSVNWVIGNGAPCNGCVEPGFPDLTSPFYTKLQEAALPSSGVYRPA